MSLLLASPHDRKLGIDILKSALALFIMPGAIGPQKDAIIKHIAALDSWGPYDVSARFEASDTSGETKLTLTYKKAEALNDGPTQARN